MHFTTRLATIALASTLAIHVNAQKLDDVVYARVKVRMRESSTKSWEIGTYAQAVLEDQSSPYSVFADTSLPPSTSLRTDNLDEIWDIARSVVSNRSESNNNVTGPQAFMMDSSSADPASIGVAILLANWTGQAGANYAEALEDQLDFLLTRVPRTNDGAISHRAQTTSLWSDFVYMVPPFLAYYGALTNNRTLIDMSFNQIRLYRNYLRDEDSGRWRHIVLGEFNDPGHWATGNGWAASGMQRVAATMKNSQFADELGEEIGSLQQWVRQIHDGMYRTVSDREGGGEDTYLFRNYVDRDNSFRDAAATAILASTVYRQALLYNEYTYIRHAEVARKALIQNDHIDNGGWLTPVVNPYTVGDEGEESPEAQAFFVLMEAAHKDWEGAGSPTNGAFKHARPGLWSLLAVATGLTLFII